MWDNVNFERENKSLEGYLEGENETIIQFKMDKAIYFRLLYRIYTQTIKYTPLERIKGDITK